MSKNKHILDKAVLPAPKSNRYFQLLERHPYLCSLLFCLLLNPLYFGSENGIPANALMLETVDASQRQRLVSVSQCWCCWVQGSTARRFIRGCGLCWAAVPFSQAFSGSPGNRYKTSGGASPCF